MAELADMTDAELVGRTLAGHRDAYKPLVGRYQGHVYGLAYSLVGNWAEAQDIAQETFIRAYVNLGQLREAGRFAAWLRRVAFGVTMNWLRTFRPGLFQDLQGQTDLEHLEIPDFRPGPPELAERRELAEAVLAAVASLPPKYRLPLTMFHLDGLSYKKVADFLDVPLGTVQGLIHRARQKLKAALPAAIAKEMTPMVEEVFNEHKLPEAFAAKVIENVPPLKWGMGKECTFVGALEAAMAVTDHPYCYRDLMGWTGLAFRVRWFCGNENSRWCGSCAVGEMEEEIAAASKATGWQLRAEVHMDDPDMGRFAPQIAASIDAGKPVPAYDEREDMAVIYGYRNGGKTLLFRDYHKGEAPHEVPAAKLGWLWLILGEHTKPMGRREAAVEAMKLAVHNWRRGIGREGPGEYWYGKEAFRVWRDDLGQVEQLGDADRKKLFFVSWWNFNALADARRCAVAFLEEAAGIFSGGAGDALHRAARRYARVSATVGGVVENKDTFLGPASGKGIADWSPAVRERERQILAEICQTESEAIAEIDKALQAAGAG